ncbi:MAG: enoyl-CoA hydratase/isomerase family protein [Deltaproteobacteria bacterium]|nr:enoyl-CoA hydratase/isomerase family protein [Deltaproteobacteria bacterium]
MAPTVLFEKTEGVGLVTFNRPEKLNALNREMLMELEQLLDQVARDPQLRVLVLTGRGRAFIAGADISLFVDLDPLTGKRFAEHAQALVSRLEHLDIPVIAAVNGYALGGGLEVALACDFIYASEEACFGQPEINLGIIPCVGGTQRLARLVGKGLAKELCLTGRLLDAAEAKAIGLAARVFPTGVLLEECLKTARSLAEKGRVALRAVKQVINRGYEVDLASALAMEIDAFAVCLASPDAREGALAFLEKRQPRFTGSL